MPAGTPGSTSKATPAPATAMASWTTESTVIGSPVISRVTRRPWWAAAIRSLATSVGSPTAGRTSASGDATARMAAGTSASVMISGAVARASRARTVSRPGSPGPAHELDPPRGDGW